MLTADRYQDSSFQTWHSRWEQRLAHEGDPMTSVLARMKGINPAVIPRNHRVEEALTAAEERDDLSVMQRLLDVLASPYGAKAVSAEYREPSPDDDRYQTFCGT
jgi:uncharacterized protein YdiU (UPF0061 family)